MAENDEHTAAVLELLQDFGVLATEPGQQIKHAESMVRGGFDAEALQITREYLEATERDTTVRSIEGIAWNILKTNSGWKNWLKSAKRRRARKESSVEPHQRNTMPARDTRGDPPEWAEQDRKRQAWCRLVYDRVPLEGVAAELGVEPGQVLALAREGGLYGGYSEQIVDHDIKLATDAKYREVHNKKVRALLNKRSGKAEGARDE